MMNDNISKDEIELHNVLEGIDGSESFRIYVEPIKTVAETVLTIVLECPDLNLRFEVLCSRLNEYYLVLAVTEDVSFYVSPRIMEGLFRKLEDEYGKSIMELSHGLWDYL